MTTVQIHIPDDIKTRFEQVFSDQAIEATIIRLMHEAMEQETLRRRAAAVDRLLARRAETRPASAEQIRTARQEGRP